MKSVKRHVTQCVLAGIVALMPLAGLVMTVVYLESQISNSWLRDQWFYFWGCGLLITAIVVYTIGLAISTFLGKWLWSVVDRMLDQMPLLGGLYQTLKQIVGYGEGPDAMFRRVVMIPSADLDGDEIGLVTNETTVDERLTQLTVFVPNAPTPTNGRLVVVDSTKVCASPLSVHQALKTLVSVGAMGD